MSLTVLLIALVPAVTVFLVAVVTGSKGRTSLAAIAAAGIGVLTGNPAYIAIDILTVGVLYWLSMWTLLRMKRAASASDKAATPVAAPPAPAFQRPSDGEGHLWVAGVLGIGLLIAFRAWSPSGNFSTLASLPARNVSPAAAAHEVKGPAVPAKTPQASAASVRSTARPAVVKAKADPTKKLSIQDCLQLKSEQQMVACVALAD